MNKGTGRDASAQSPGFDLPSKLMGDPKTRVKKVKEEQSKKIDGVLGIVNEWDNEKTPGPISLVAKSSLFCRIPYRLDS